MESYCAVRYLEKANIFFFDETHCMSKCGWRGEDFFYIYIALKDKLGKYAYADFTEDSHLIYWSKCFINAPMTFLKIGSCKSFSCA